jgi:endonuclease/exonuclease/phosphatase family metal-dependent hydrolase
MKKYFYGFLILFSVSIFFTCKEVITPKPPAQNSQNNSNGKDNGKDGGKAGGKDNGKDGGNSDNKPVTGTYTKCLNALSAKTLDVATWNIEQFSSSNTDLEKIKEIIKTMDADIIGVQEIRNISDFNSVANSIDGWKGSIVKIKGGLNIGYFYKSSEITLLEDLSTIYSNKKSAFPRPPVIGKFQHVSGLKFTVFNIHLKCCGGSKNENRRREAADLLKTYIDNNFKKESVIVVGDYNDEIQENPAKNVFKNFIDDATNYKFTDMEIAKGSSDNWSFSSWPSQIDHILITNELFSILKSTSTLKLDNCLNTYKNVISDHRPVMVRFIIK